MGFPAPPPNDNDESSSGSTTAPWDPNNWVHNPPKTFVQIQNTTRQDLNGCLGLVVGYDVPAGRYLVHLCRKQTKASFKADKLKRASWVQSMVGQVQIVRYNPDVRSKLNEMLHTATGGDTKRAIWMGAGFALLMAMFLYLLGFTKTMILVSYGLLVALVVGPDLVSGRTRSIEEAMNDIPANAQKLIRESVPLVGPRIGSSKLATMTCVGALSFYVFWTVLVGR